MLSKYRLDLVLHIFVFFFLFKTNSYPQNSKNSFPTIVDNAELIYDSMITKLNQASIDTIKINILNEIAWHFAPTNFSKSLQFSDSALSLSRKIDWKKGEATALKNKGEALRFKGDIQKALLNHEASLSIFKYLQDQEGIASLLSNIGIEYFMLSDFAKSFDYYSRALAIYRELENNPGTLKNLQLMGVLFYEFKRYEKALEYYNKALILSRNNNNEIDIASQLVNIGLSKLKMNIYHEAIQSFNEALELFKNNHDKYNYTITLGNLGLAYSKINKFDLALNNFRYALKNSKELNDKYGIAYQLGNLGAANLDYYKSKKDSFTEYKRKQLLNSSKKQFTQAVKLFEELKNIYEQGYYSLKLSEVYKELGNANKSLEFLEKYSTLQNKLFSEENKRTISDLEVKQNLVLRDMEIELLNKDKEYQTLVKEVLIGIAILLILGLLFFYWLYRTKQKQNSILEQNIRVREEAEEALRKNEIELNNHKEQLEVLVKRRTEALEKEIVERKIIEENLRIAFKQVEDANKAKTIFLENMSHELRTPLVGILGYSQLISSESPNSDLKEMGEGINRTGTRLLNTLSMVLDLARIESDQFEIHVTDVSIKNVLNDIYNNFKGAVLLKNIKFILNLNHELEFVPTDEGMFKVIIENLVNNAIKFTKEGSIIVESKNEYDENGKPKDLIINVIDTGIGIKKEEIDEIFKAFKQLSEGTLKDFQGTGLGLSISKRFISHLGGELLVESEFGKGSKFTIKLPLK